MVRGQLDIDSVDRQILLSALRRKISYHDRSHRKAKETGREVNVALHAMKGDATRRLLERLLKMDLRT